MIWLLAGWSAVALLLAIAIGRTLGGATKERSGCDGNDAVPQWARADSTTNTCQGPTYARPTAEMVAVQRMLAHLERHHPDLPKLVVLSWIGGLSTQAVAETMGMSLASVEHDLLLAKSLLQQEGAAGAAPGSGS
jgi:DNA-directed RNA polymerase specialized sigma24 family protein